MSTNKICPFCLLKKVFVPARRVSSVPDDKFDNGVALTPPMGWSSWNCFRNKIDEDGISEIGDALVKSGLLEAGYGYINLDDCWQSSVRTESGEWQGDFATFPHGIPSLIEKLNGKGLKVGLYSSNGTLTCEDLPASLGREKQDARTMAEWGVEYFKYDFCHHRFIPSSAPLVSLVEIGRPGEKPLLKLAADGARLEGIARVRPDDKMPTKTYVSGLDKGEGAMTFENLTVAESGEYYINFVVKKFGGFDKYVVVEVNGEKYEMEFPATKHFNYTAHNQINIRLNAGNNVVKVYNPVKTRADSTALQYRKMARLLDEAASEVALARGTAKKPIVFSVCEWGMNKPYMWGAGAGNLWRTTPDIRPVWSWIMTIYRHNVKLWKYGGPGGWNDPDMLEVGNGKLTAEEGRAHFSLWCMMASPLILGNDLRKLYDADGKLVDLATFETITNKNLIAIDQDPLGKPAKPVKLGAVDILVRPLAGGKAAVCLLNRFGGEKKVRLPMSLFADPYIGIDKREQYTLTDQWSGEALSVSDSVTVSVPRHGVRVFVL